MSNKKIFFFTEKPTEKYSQLFFRYKYITIIGQLFYSFTSACLNTE